MHPRNLHLYFFSPTGGTQHVAGLFAENLNAADACTDITVCAEAKTFSADDCLLVFFPVYGGRVPGPCLARVRALRGTDTPAVLVAVFGNRAVDDALLEMRDTLAPLGFRVIAAAEVIAPHSVNTDIAASRPDASDRAKIAEFCTQLKSRIPLRGQQQDIRRLGHAFHRVHAGQHRLTGEVALENLAGRVHKKCGHDVVACLHLLHGIHQQHGVPVGDDGLDLFFGKLHDSGSSLSRKTLRI